MAENRTRRCASFFACLLPGLLCAGILCLNTTADVPDHDTGGVSAESSANTSAAEKDKVFLGGMPVGIYMETDGVMVLSTEQIRDTEGNCQTPASGLVRSGDYITAVNHREIKDKSDLLEEVDRLGDGNVTLTLRRNSSILDVQIVPAEYAPDKYRLGIWVRDNVQGLGTITFVTESGRFGALGHGIHDIDTEMLMSIDSGKIYRTTIRDITKGHSGSPGTMEGIIVYNNYNILGDIEKNTGAGIYGTIKGSDALFADPVSVRTAKKEEIHTGPATVRCYVDNRMEEYEIRVTDIDMSGNEVNKGFVIEVTDPDLLEMTGGIIQGMSGSPIMQDGKLIGAVTHVFVQDSTKGYGIFIENMLNEV